MDKLVLLDSNSLINRAFYALPPMNSADGRPTNAVYGFVNMLLKIIKDVRPTHLIATFDMKAPTFRKEMYGNYKGTRKPMPEDLVAQIPILKDVLEAMNIEILTLEGYEADDIIGSISKKCGFETIIVTGDRDSLQLISDSTKVWLTKKGISEIIEYDEKRLSEDGLTPSQIIDLKSLMGDSSDNIPGVPGVGEKTAMNLIYEYGTLDGVYSHIDDIKGKLKEKLIENKELAYLSYRLATINLNTPVEFDAGKSRLRPFESKVKKICEELNFKSIIPRLEITEENSVAEELVKTETILINNSDDLKKLIIDIEKNGFFVFVYDSNLRIALDENTEYKLATNSNLLEMGLNYEEVIDTLENIFLSDKISKITFDLKTVWHQLNGKILLNCDDVALKAYLCDSNKTYKNTEDFLIKSGYTGDTLACGLITMNKKFDNIMKELKLSELYSDIELPLVDTLYDMEKTGFRLDLNLMQAFKQKYTTLLKDLSEEIYAFNDGNVFNLNSPKQLGVFLFETLGLKHGKKNKTGYSTNVDVLESLRGDSEVVDKILKYRQISKLSSTYIEGLYPLLKGDRLHTVFKQMLTATGRLSSTEPNLQNIPIRSEEGRELRKMFIASEGNSLLCADYSQIELRLLAHYSRDEILTQAFNNGLDIHSITASKAFGVPAELVTKDMRRKAKAVNFGIIYGISDFGLATDIGISTKEAKEFIHKYFETYPNVKHFMDNSVAQAVKDGYVRTIKGRVRFIPELKATNKNIRNFGERIAMNMPLQGSASDIIKIAMINTHKRLCEGGYKAKLVLQVHDELIIDCPDGEIAEVSKILNECMTGAVDLNVKLIADVSVAKNWFETK